MKPEIITPINYYGGKQTMLRHILPLMPNHHLYCEPFFGGGAVFFGKKPSKVEVINDKSAFVINFYKQVQQNFKSLQALVQSTLHSRMLYEHACHIYKIPQFFSDVEQAWALWMLSTASFNGVLAGSFSYGKKKSCKAVTTANRRVRFTSRLERRVSRCVIENQDALEVIPRFDGENSFFYLDPPYIDTNQGHYKGYLREDYEQLLRQLARLKGKFMLSSFPNEPLKAAIAEQGWQLKAFDKSLQASMKAGARKTGVLVCNYALPNISQNNVALCHRQIWGHLSFAFLKKTVPAKAGTRPSSYATCSLQEQAQDSTLVYNSYEYK